MREHRMFAALYDRMTAPVERAGFEFRGNEEFQTGPCRLPTSPTFAGIAEVA